MRFNDLRLTEPIVRAVATEGYTTPTPIQIKAIPEVLAGRDVLGCAQTGTGKTGAFALPILHRLATSTAGRRTLNRTRHTGVTWRYGTPSSSEASASFARCARSVPELTCL